MNYKPVIQRLRHGSLAVAGAAALITLASCGGSGNSSSPPPVTPPPASNEPPASASASVTGFIDYLLSLTATMQDTVEPLDLTNFTAPISDTTEPDPRP